MNYLGLAKGLGWGTWVLRPWLCRTPYLLPSLPFVGKDRSKDFSSEKRVSVRDGESETVREGESKTITKLLPITK